MRFARTLGPWAAALLLNTLLAGCATSRMVDSEVRSFASSPTLSKGVDYQFERLPSQQGGSASQERVEAIAQQALKQAGLVRKDAQARYSVQLRVQTEAIANPRARSSAGFMIFGGNLGWGMHHPLGMPEPSWYRHSVHLVLRDVANAKVVYETQAQHEGPWTDTLRLLPAMLEAALQDYPNPRPESHTVVIELPSRDQGDE